MKESKFKNYDELKANFDVVYDTLNAFIMNEGIITDTALYGALSSARGVLINATRYFDQYNYDKD